MANQQQYNFRPAVRGDTYSQNAEFTIQLNSVPVDLTGATIKMVIQGNTQNRNKLLSNGNGLILITDPAAGKFKTNIGVVDFFTGGNFRYDIEIALSSGSVKTWIFGKFTVLEDITV